MSPVDRTKRRGDVHNAISEEDLHVSVQLPFSCHLIHLKWFPCGLDYYQGEWDSGKNKLDHHERIAPPCWVGRDITNCQIEYLHSCRCREFHKRWHGSVASFDPYLWHILANCTRCRWQGIQRSVQCTTRGVQPVWSSTDCTSHTGGGSWPLQRSSSFWNMWMLMMLTDSTHPKN